MPYEDDLDLDPHQALIEAVRRNPALVTPTQGERKKPTRREQAWDLMQRANDLAARPVQPYQGGGGDLAAGMALQAMGGRALAPMGGQILKQTLAARAPLDPVKLREMEVQNLMRSGALAESMAQHEETTADRAATLAEQQRRSIEAAADRRQREAVEERRHAEGRQLQYAQLGLSRQAADRAEEAAKRAEWQVVTDPVSGRSMVVNKLTMQTKPLGGGEGPAQAAVPGAARTFPAEASLKATEDERRAAYQVEAIADRLNAIGPESASPGAFEALGRTLIPGEAGEGVANFLSSAPRQIARASQEGVVDALLYLSTGAAYNKEQLTQARREYLPSYTDKPDTVAAKRSRLEALAQAARNRAGRAWTQVQEDKLQSAMQSYYGDAPQTEKALPRATAPKGDAKSRADAYLRGQ